MPESDLGDPLSWKAPELKRAHGLGRLRVRGGLAVRLAVFLKTTACNVKRMVRALDARRTAASPQIG